MLDRKEGRLRWGRGVLLPGIAGALCLWAASYSKPNEWFAFAAFLAIGAALYLFSGWRRKAA